MDIKFENIDKASGKLTINVTLDDYQENLEKSLKNFRRKAQMKGFRPGNVPMPIVKKLYGPEAKADEVSKAVNSAIDKYLKDNNMHTIGQPLPDPDQKEQDFKKSDNFQYIIDIALEPKYSLSLDKKDKVKYYDIATSDKQIDEQVERILKAKGKYVPADSFDGSDGYMKGELAEVSPAEGQEPIKIEGTIISPEFVKDEKQKKLFDGVKKGDTVTICPATLYGDKVQAASMLKIKQEELDKHSGDFTYKVTEVFKHQPAEINQELFDSLYGKDVVKSEKEFRDKIGEEFSKVFTQDSDSKFLGDLMAYCLGKVGKLEFSEYMLKRYIKDGEPNIDDKTLDDKCKASMGELTQMLVRNWLTSNAKIKIDEKELLDAARKKSAEQFQAYGMSMPDELLDKYAKEFVKDEKKLDRLYSDILADKLVKFYKDYVTLDTKKVSYDDFVKICEEDYKKANPETAKSEAKPAKAKAASAKSESKTKTK